MATATSEPVRLPPALPIPKAIQGLGFLFSQHKVFAALDRRYGHAFTLNLPYFGQTVIISDPTLVKDIFSTSLELIGRPVLTYGEVLGYGSTFNLEGTELVERRRLLLPPFHSKRVGSYESIIEEEVMREIAGWPEGREFETLEPMMRITVSAILRAVFGAEGPALDELRELVPPGVTLGARLLLLPAIMRRDLGPWSTGGRLLHYRRRIDALIESLIAEARADPALEDRRDVLSLLLQARYDNGDPISDQHIADELLTLMSAGHETTSLTLAWAVERLRRHPELLQRLTDEADRGGSVLRQATIWEVQRTRSVSPATMRRTKSRIRLGEWVLPENCNVMISIELAHASSENFPHPERFDPDRFAGGAPTPFAWIPFGGGINRCVGAAFANMEMDVTLRTLLRELRLEPTAAPDERRHNRGLNIAPARGGRAVVYRRKTTEGSAGDSISAGDRASPQTR
ncbi:MAG: cytochrome P450 [Mycolicibacterium sp.]|uniref:cytochrome P450 n=1 Tax=Mycolicibacterium sp. TaxID=2320850 RepID=UPI003D10B469